jgi:RNA polymerase sigma factor (sigma-70 family)
MNRGYFHSISSSSEDNEFAFWIENQAHHPEVLRLLVERYASDIYHLGHIWIYGFQIEQPEEIQIKLFEFTQDVFSQAMDKLSDSIGQESIGIWLYKISLQEAKRYHRKFAIRPTQLFSQKSGKIQHSQEDDSHASITKRLDHLQPRQRLILTLRHTYQIDLSDIAAILGKDVPFVQYELSTARQILFGTSKTGNDEQEICSDPDFRYILQAYYDGLLHSNEYMPLELEKHLSECKFCNKLNDELIQLEETITSLLNNQPPDLFEFSGDRKMLVENIENGSVNIGSRVRRGIDFIRQSFVIIAILTAITLFAINNLTQDTHKGMPLYQPIPKATPTAYVLESNSFQFITVAQTQPLKNISTTYTTPVRIDGRGYCTVQMQEEEFRVPLQECLESYYEWIAFRWFYSERYGSVNYLKGLAFSPDGNTLAGLSADSYIHSWQAEDGKLLDSKKLDTSTIHDIVYSPDGNQIAVGVNNGTLQTMTNFDHFQIALQNFGGPVFSLDFSPDGKTLTAGGKDAAWSFDISKDKIYVLDYYPFPGNQVISLDFSPIGDLLAFGLDDGKVWLFRFKDAKPLARLSGHDGKVSQIVFSPDSNYLASGAADGNVILWDISDTMEVNKILTLSHPDQVTGLDISPDGTILSTTSLGGEGVFLWSIPNGTLLNKIANDYFFTASSLSFSPDGNTLAIGSTTGSVKLWKISDAERISQNRPFSILAARAAWSGHRTALHRPQIHPTPFQ